MQKTGGLEEAVNLKAEGHKRIGEEVANAKFYFRRNYCCNPDVYRFNRMHNGGQDGTSARTG